MKTGLYRCVTICRTKNGSRIMKIKRVDYDVKKRRFVRVK
jgi:hypothetical protein